MKRKIFIGVLWLSLLAWCGMKSSNPEEVIKQTQVNISNQMSKLVFAKKKAQYDSNLAIKASMPQWSWELNAVFTWKVDNYTWIVNTDISLWFVVNWMSGSASLNWKVLTTPKNLYFNLAKLDVNFPDPNIMAYVTMAKMMLNKWFVLPLQNDTSMTNAIKSINFKNEIKKYSLFKVKKVIKDRTYDVELDKENISKIIVDINKQIDPKFTWTVSEIKSELWTWNIEWTLSIQSDNLHFSFSGYVVTSNEKMPFKMDYLSDKFMIDLPSVLISLKKDQDKFNWYILIKQANQQLNVSGLLNDSEFKINLGLDNGLVKGSVALTYKAKTIDKVEINIPKNAINLEQAMWAMGK